jgi:hypothetical protein
MVQGSLVPALLSNQNPRIEQVEAERNSEASTACKGFARGGHPVHSRLDHWAARRFERRLLRRAWRTAPAQRPRPDTHTRATALPPGGTLCGANWQFRGAAHALSRWLKASVKQLLPIWSTLRLNNRKLQLGIGLHRALQRKPMHVAGKFALGALMGLLVSNSRVSMPIPG